MFGKDNNGGRLEDWKIRKG